MGNSGLVTLSGILALIGPGPKQTLLKQQLFYFQECYFLFIHSFMSLLCPAMCQQDYMHTVENQEQAGLCPQAQLLSRSAHHGFKELNGAFPDLCREQSI